MIYTSYCWAKKIVFLEDCNSFFYLVCETLLLFLGTTYIPSILFILVMLLLLAPKYGTQLVRADCISAEEYEPPNECPGYDIKQSDGEVPVMLELWEMQSTPLLPSLPGPLWPGVVSTC